jgi:hypothetical protein
MNKNVKRVLIGLAVAVLLMLIAAVVIAGFFQDAVGRKLIREINKELTTELKVGDFDLSLLRGFPDATATLRDVVVEGLNKGGLLEAKEMSFHFRLLSLFGSKVKVHSMTIRDGALNILIDKTGKANYDIFKPSKDETESDFNISLKTARLENMELAYQDLKLNQTMLTKVEEAVFSGEFSNKQYDLKSTAKLASNFIDLGGVRYFAGKKWGYDAVISVDVNRGKYDFQKFRLILEDNAFNVNGYVQSQKKFTDFDLTATAEDANLETVIALLPKQYLAALGDFSSTGKFKFGAAVKGKLSAAERPAIHFEFSLDNGKLTSPRLIEPFKDVSFDASFTNGVQRSNQNSVFEISNFKGYLERELITMSLRMEDLDNPQVDFQADGALPVGYIYGLFNYPAITDGSGEVEIRNLKVNGLYNDMISIHRIVNVVMSGDINFDDAILEINKEKMLIDRGTLRFSDNLMTLEDLKLEGVGSQVSLQGFARNLLPVLLADSLNSQNAVLEFQADLLAPAMDVGRFVKLTDVPVKEGQVQQEVYDSLKVAKYEGRQHFTDFLKGVFNASIDEFRYDKIEGQDFTGKMTFENGQMRIEGNTRGMDGIFALDGTVFFEKEPRLEAKLDCERIDIKKFFEQTNNAGQTYLTAENLAGIMNAKMLIHAFWDSTGNFDMDKLHVWAGVGIKNGELKGFKMLEEFSSYANIQDLRKVRFMDLQNWLEVKNSTFYLPSMFIQNNAMNMTVSGEQTFDDKIDYNIKVNAGQVLTQKFKKHNTKLEPIPAKENGFFNLYFNIAGTLDDYKYESNKRKVKDKFNRSESQKRLIRAALIKAFGAPLNMLREPKGWEDKGETSPVEEDEYIPGF